jgi:hypothetical protein
VFAGPVLWTAKRPATAHNRTARDRTSGCSCVDFKTLRLPVAAFSGNHKTDEDRLQSVATGLFGSLLEDVEKKQILCIYDIRCVLLFLRTRLSLRLSRGGKDGRARAVG